MENRGNQEEKKSVKSTFVDPESSEYIMKGWISYHTIDSHTWRSSRRLIHIFEIMKSARGGDDSHLFHTRLGFCLWYEYVRHRPWQIWHLKVTKYWKGIRFTQIWSVKLCTVIWCWVLLFIKAVYVQSIRPQLVGPRSWQLPPFRFVVWLNMTP